MGQLSQVLNRGLGYFYTSGMTICNEGEIMVHSKKRDFSLLKRTVTVCIALMMIGTVFLGSGMNKADAQPADVASLRIKELYLHDDGSFDDDDPTDILDRNEPTNTTLGDYDDDGEEGLTIERGEDISDPNQYQDFELTPELSEDFYMALQVNIYLWIKPEKKNKNGWVHAELFDYYSGTYTSIGVDTVPIREPVLLWKEYQLAFLVNYTVPALHKIILRLKVTASSQTDFYFAYDTVNYDSHIEFVTATVVHVQWVKTFNDEGAERFIFRPNDMIEIRAKIYDPFGSYDIIGANITIINSENVVMVDDHAMSLLQVDSGSPSRWKVFTYLYSTGTVETYTATVTAVEGNGVNATGSTTFYVTRPAEDALGLQEFYILGDEDDLLDYFEDATPYHDVSAPIHSYVSITTASDDTRIYLDEHEDGYDFVPIDASTADASFVINKGENLTLTENDKYVPYSNGVDGGDRLYVVRAPIYVVRVVWPDYPGSYMAGTWELYPVQGLENSYTVPVGEDLWYTAFRHSYLFVEAVEDDTNLVIDDPSNSGIEVNITLSRGENYCYPHVNSGTTVEGNKTLQAGLATAIGLAVDSRFYTLIPTQFLGNDYYIPTPSFSTGSIGPPTTSLYIYAFNNSTTVNIETKTESVNTTLNASEIYRYFMPIDTAAHVYSNNKIWVMMVFDEDVDNDGSNYDNDGDVYDWGTSALYTELLDTEYYIPFAPANPLYVTPVENNTVFYMDYHSDGIIETSFTLDRLDYEMLYPPSWTGYDTTGAHIYADKPFAAWWGQDNSQETPGERPPGGGPDKDFGYTLTPYAFMVPFLAVSSIANPRWLPYDGGEVDFFISVNSFDSSIGEINITDALPYGWSYIANSTTIIFPDGSVLNGSNANPVEYNNYLFWNLSYNLSANEDMILSFKAQTSTVWGLNPNTAMVTGTVFGMVFNPTYTTEVMIATPPKDLYLRSSFLLKKDEPGINPPTRTVIPEGEGKTWILDSPTVRSMYINGDINVTLFLDNPINTPDIEVTLAYDDGINPIVSIGSTSIVDISSDDWYYFIITDVNTTVPAGSTLLLYVNETEDDGNPWVDHSVTLVSNSAPYNSGITLPITNNPPSVTLLSPNVGQVWSGVKTIYWNATDPDVGEVLMIDLEYSSDNGATWHTIANDVPNSGQYNWDTTTVADGTNYLIRVNASDIMRTATDISDVPFTIDNLALTQTLFSPNDLWKTATFSGFSSQVFYITLPTDIAVIDARMDVTAIGPPFPSSPAIDITDDGDYDWFYTGEYNTTETTLDFAVELRDYLTLATGSSIDVPINLTAINGGIRISNLNIRYYAPDLTVYSINLSRTFPAEGETVTINATILNIGYVDAYQYVVELLIDDTPVSAELVDTFANSSSLVTFNWSATTVGLHSIKVIADYTNLINEMNESNNERSTTLTVVTGRDLIPFIEFSNDRPSNGETVRIDVTVRNVWEGIAFNVYVKVIIDDVTVLNYNLGTIEPFSSKSTHLYWTYDGEEHVVRFIADPDDKIAEVNENNNEGSRYIPRPKERSSLESFDVAFYAIILISSVSAVLAVRARRRD